MQVDVPSAETLIVRRQLTSRAFLTFVAVSQSGARLTVHPLILETDGERRVAAEAHARREHRLRKKQENLELGIKK